MERKLFVLLLMCLGLSGLSQSASGQTQKKIGVFLNTDDLADDCRSAIHNLDGTTDSNEQNASECFNYIKGVNDFIQTEMSWGVLRGTNRLCPPDDLTIGQAVRVFAKYADAHPENLHVAASSSVYNAMRVAFTCPASK